MNLNRVRHTLMICSTLFVLTFLASGCEQKEKIFDLDTPEGGVEVERDKSTGEVGVEIEDKDQEEETP